MGDLRNRTYNPWFNESRAYNYSQNYTYPFLNQTNYSRNSNSSRYFNSTTVASPPFYNSFSQEYREPQYGYNYGNNDQHQWGKHHKNRPHHDNDMTIDFNFDEVSEEDAKQMAHQIITFTVLAVLVWTLILTGCIGGCCLCVIGKAKHHQKARETYISMYLSSNA